MGGAKIAVAVKRLPHGRGLELPEYVTPGSAGMDLRAAVPEEEPLVLGSGQIELVPTGLAVEIPPGYEGQVRPRSGLAINKGITLINAPGTVDSDYRGELKCALINLGRGPVTINRGERIAQMIIAPVVQAEISEKDELSDTVRGEGGFGSTGV